MEAVETHETVMGRVQHTVAAVADFYSAASEKAMERKGVKCVSIPNRNTKSPARFEKQKQR